MRMSRVDMQYSIYFGNTFNLGLLIIILRLAYNIRQKYKKQKIK